MIGFAKKQDPAPEVPLYVIGDIHGRADLLDALLQAIDVDMADQGRPDAQLVFIGDYVDRGPQSRVVLDLLFHLQTKSAQRVICLMGNHERMMLDFLDRPDDCGTRWLRNGGVQTLEGFGLNGAYERMAPERHIEFASSLRATMDDGLEAWLRALPLWHRSGDVVCAHAAMDPARPPDAQSPETLLWGRPRLFLGSRKDGLWTVHGHTIVHAPNIAQRRIAIDTGAYYSDRLTAAAIYPNAPVRFLQTES